MCTKSILCIRAGPIFLFIFSLDIIILTFLTKYYCIRIHIIREEDALYIQT